MAVAIGIVVFVVLIAMAAYFAASETALMKVSRIRIRYLVEKGEPKARKLEKLIEDPDRFLPTLLLMLLTVQLTTASLATWLATRILNNNAGIGILVGTAVATALMFIFGELVPKAAASHNSERVSLMVTRPVSFLSRIFSPISKVFEFVARGILRILGRESQSIEKIIRDEGEIKALVSVAEEDEVIEEQEKEMIHSVFEFGDTVVHEVMVPRPDMVVLPAAATIRDSLVEITENGFSRIPVYEETIDKIVGILYAKDLMDYLIEGRFDKNVKDLVRQAYVIPETKRISDLLREFQKRKVHISIVVDEYGTVVGLVTIEDLLEEIVGEIFDEFDREEKLVERIGANRYRVDARLNMDDLNERLKIEMPHEDVDTVGGLVFKVLGNVPDPGESFTYSGVTFKVERVRNNRVSMVIMDITGEAPS